MNFLKGRFPWTISVGPIWLNEPLRSRGFSQALVGGLLPKRKAQRFQVCAWLDQLWQEGTIWNAAAGRLWDQLLATASRETGTSVLQPAGIEFSQQPKWAEKQILPYSLREGWGQLTTWFQPHGTLSRDIGEFKPDFWLWDSTFVLF